MTERQRGQSTKDMAAAVFDTPAIDLFLCEQEPIHTPGAIQPHGALLASTKDGSRITHASANLDAILGHPAEAALGRPLADVLGETACHILVNIGAADAVHLGHVCSIPGPDDSMLHLQSHVSGPLLCIDIEPLTAALSDVAPVVLAQSVIETFKQATSRTQLCELAVRGLKELTGYDRVMAYHFSEDGHGTVIAEVCEPELEPYLGFSYPASDIPAQARRHYLQQRVGLVANSSYNPVPLLVDPALEGAEPLDLTHSALRSVSPIHREYMRNMGTAASLTLGLAYGLSTGGPSLWGMLVCHHTQPRIASVELRASAYMIAQVVSRLLGTMDAAEVFAQRIDRDHALQALEKRLASPGSLLDTLETAAADVLHLVGATGAVVRSDGDLRTLGRTPPPALAELALDTVFEGSSTAIVAINDLSLRHPNLIACAAAASGALLLPLPHGPGDAILWFRPERTEDITWAGNPDTHATMHPVTGRLSPRVSFAAWKAIVRGYAKPWSEIDCALAAELGGIIARAIARNNKQVLAVLEHVVDTLPIALILCTEAGLIKRANLAAENLFGYDGAGLEGLQIDQLLAPDCQDEYRHQHRICVTHTGRNERLTVSALHRDGSAFRIAVDLESIKPPGFTGDAMIQIKLTEDPVD